MVEASDSKQQSIPVNLSDNKEKQLDFLRFEYETIIEEYKMSNTRVMRELDADDKGFQFNIISIGAVVVAATFVLQHKAYFFLLVLAMPFHLLTWAQARRIIWLARLVNYVRNVLAPRLNNIIKQIASKSGFGTPIDFVSWEEFANAYTEGNFILNLSVALPQIGRAILQISIAIALTVAYFYLKSPDKNYKVNTLDEILIWFNIISIIISIVLLISASIVRLEQTKKK